MTTRKHVFYGILALVSLLGLGITQSARANYMVTLEQIGTNVVGTGSGSLDITNLGGNYKDHARMIPSNALLLLGPTANGFLVAYQGISGPSSFGSGPGAFADTGSGNFVGVNGFFSTLFVAPGYISATPLGVSTDTWNNATFASLGITPGTYTWTWGTGMHADSFTLQIGPAGVPDGGSTVSLLGCALLGVAVLRRKLRC